MTPDAPEEPAPPVPRTRAEARVAALRLDAAPVDEGAPRPADAFADALVGPDPDPLIGEPADRTWLQGTDPRGWNLTVVALATASLIFTIFGAQLVVQAGDIGPLLAVALVWAGMLAPVIYAFSRARPVGLLRFRSVDLLYGVVLGAIVRTMQGALAVAGGEAGTFPSYPLIDGRLSDAWWFTDFVAPVLVAPVLEEFFFRALILVGLFVALRGRFGASAAMFVAYLGSTVLFLLAHLWGGGGTWDAMIAVILLGTVGALLVLYTGRIWGAVVLHIVFNGSYVMLALVGTFF